jgi:hypothetical protein
VADAQCPKKWAEPDIAQNHASSQGAAARARLSYKRDADTLGGWYGEGVATYVSQRGSLDFEDRR